MRNISRHGVVLLLVPLMPSSAEAQGLCVECQGPDQNYSCSIKDVEKVPSFRGAQRAQEYVCISEVARAGGHQNCRVSTSYSGPCMGQPFEIDIAKLGTDAPVVGRQPGDATADPEGSPAQKAAPAKKGPPQTLEELARQTMAKSKEQMSDADAGVKKAGDAVGGAVKKTWECVASLFQKC